MQSVVHGFWPDQRYPTTATLTFDEEGRLVREVQDSRVRQLLYGPGARLESDETRELDKAGRPTRLGSMSSYVYDREGRLRAIRSKSRFKVGGPCRPVACGYVNPPCKDSPERVEQATGEETYAYDGAGRLQRHVVGSDSWTYRYQDDRVDEIVEESKWQRITTRFTYGASGQPVRSNKTLCRDGTCWDSSTTITWQDGRVVEVHGRDWYRRWRYRCERLVAIEERHSVKRFAYDADGRLERVEDISDDPRDSGREPITFSYEGACPRTLFQPHYDPIAEVERVAREPRTLAQFAGAD